MHLTGYLSNSKNWNRFAIGLLRRMHRVTRKYADLHKLLLFLVAPPPAVWGVKAIFCSSNTVRDVELLFIDFSFRFDDILSIYHLI